MKWSKDEWTIGYSTNLRGRRTVSGRSIVSGRSVAHFLGSLSRGGGGWGGWGGEVIRRRNG